MSVCGLSLCGVEINHVRLSGLMRGAAIALFETATSALMTAVTAADEEIASKSLCAFSCASSRAVERHVLEGSSW